MFRSVYKRVGSGEEGGEDEIHRNEGNGGYLPLGSDYISLSVGAEEGWTDVCRSHDLARKHTER